jgi:hypothetical protein
VSDEPFRFIKSILETKNYLYDSDPKIKEYSPFFTNRALSQHIDSIYHVSAMDINRHIPAKWHYDYLFHAIRKMKRPRRKWGKKIADDKTQLIMDYYNLSYKKAKAIIGLVTDDQLVKMKESMDTGG